jgi:hypothetical protein
MTTQAEMEAAQIKILKDDLNDKITAAEKAAFEYFRACPVGPERERAHDIYTQILYSRRAR